MKKLINSEIKASKIMVIDKNGKKIGEIGLLDGLALAQTDNLDLIQVNEEEIPVCKIANYNKMIYEEKKKLKSNLKPDNSSKMKEVKFKTAIGEHDLQTKISQINTFLEKGNRVQITIVLNRHQKERSDVAKDFLNQVLSGLSQKYSLQGNPAMRDYSYGVVLMSGVKKVK
jgi:translation initiation factor IF-3